MFNFLQYGTTAQVARATGAGEDLTAARLGAQCSLALARLRLWRSRVAVALLAEPVVDLCRRRGATAVYAVTYLRIAALGIPVGVSRDRRSGLPPRRLRPADAARDRDRRQRRQRHPRDLRSSTASTSGSRARRGGPSSPRPGWASRWPSSILRRVGRANAGVAARARAAPALARQVHLHPHRLADRLVRARRRRRRAARRRAARRAPDRVPALDLPRPRPRRDRDRRPDHRRAGARSAATRRRLRRERADDLALGRRRVRSSPSSCSRSAV